MIRIWDCFLLEGPKVLFRFAVGLLAMYEDELLQRTDTISVMKVLKASVRLTFDYQELFNASTLLKAFDPTNRFPSREYLKRKQHEYLTLLNAKLNRRKRICREFINKSLAIEDAHLVASVVIFSDDQPTKGFLAYGHQNAGYLSEIIITEKSTKLQRLDISFDCRILSLAVVSKGTVFVSLLSSTIVSLRSNISSHFEVIWELNIDAVALKIEYYNDRLLLALANGSITVVENAFESTTNELELFNLPIGAAPISDMIIVDDTLWLALACKIVVLNASTLTTVKNIYIASSINGTNMAMFEKIRCFTASPFGVWTVTVNSTVIQLWKDSDCLLLYDISYDHLHRLPSLSERSDKIEVQITKLMYVRQQLWVGTNDGHVFIYSACKSNNSNGQAAVDGQFKYPAGKRLLPTFSYDNSGMSSVSCYIPTANETEIDEQNSVAEFSHHRRRAQKFSATRQCNTRQFLVPRKNSVDSLFDTPRSSVSSNCGKLNNNLQRKYSVDHTTSNYNSNSPLALFSPSLLPHQESNDSAVSVFFPEENNDAARYRSFSFPSTSTISPKSDKTNSPNNSEKFSFDETKLRRKDLDFENTFARVHNFKDSNRQRMSCSTQATGSGLREYNISLVLEMKVKIADKAVKCITSTRIGDSDVVITCAGNYNDPESVLKWSIKNNDVSNDEIWINDPVYLSG